MTCAIRLANISQFRQKGAIVINYTVYHLHSELSLLDSTTNFKDYVDRAKELGQKAICFTEHGNTFNWVDKKMYCESNGIKYMHGVEIYLTESHDEKIRDNYHTVLIAKNYEGFKELNTLIDLSTDSLHTYYKPRLSFDEFFEISDNIIKISACLQSPLNKIQSRVAEVEEPLMLQQYYERLIRAYDYYEVQPHLLEEQKEYNRKLVSLSEATGIPLIAGTDTHSVNAYKAECRTMLQYGKDIFFEDEDTVDLTYKSYDELVEMFKNQSALSEETYIKAIENTNVLADSVEEFELDLSFKYPVIDGDIEKLFMERVNTMYTDKVKRGVIQSNQVYIDNIKEEFRVLKKIGMLSFMYFMSELCCWCEENGIPRGYCRGSVGGSYIAYILDVIDVNPFSWKTKFSRFANEDRVEIGDIDCDFSPEDREKVYEYIINRFGQDKTAFILTTNTLADKGTIDEIVRGLANKYRRDNGLSKDSETSYSLDLAKEIKKLFEEEPEKAKKEYAEIFYYFDGMRGCVVSKGIHPAGIVASPVALSDNYGTFWNDGQRVMSINMEEIHEVSLVKYDILGLKNVGIIKETCRLANIPYPKSHELNWNDEKVWADMITSPVAIFQFEGDYSFDLLKKFKPQKINDMSLVNASLRPSGASYRDRLIARIPNKNPSPIIDELLKDNLQYLVFQEDVTKFLQDICGLSGSEADNVRRAIGRKDEKRLKKALPQILKSYCEKSEKPRAEAEEEAKVFLQIIGDASSYMFGYNHSTGYSMVGYTTAYLRYYYPAEFIASCLNLAKDESDVNNGTELAKLKGVQIEPVKFRKSQWKYMVDSETKIVYKGFSSIKYMSEASAQALNELKDIEFPSFTNLLFALKDSVVDTRQVDILIKIGFFQEFGDTNKLDKVNELFNKLSKKKSIKRNQVDELGLTEDFIEKFSGKSSETRIDEIDCLAFVTSIDRSENDLEDCQNRNGGYSSKKAFKKFEITDKQKEKFATKTVIGSFSEINMIGLIVAYERTIDVAPMTVSQICQYQYDYLGYIEYTDEDLDNNRYVVVTNLNTKYSPKFDAYCLRTGELSPMKISKTRQSKVAKITNSFKDTPVEDGDIIYIERAEKLPKKRKIGEEWVVVQDEWEWWIRAYRKVQM